MLTLLEDKIAVIPLEDPDKIGSIWIPDTAKQRIDQGLIKYRGPKCKQLRVGDHVFFGGYTGTKVSIEGEGTVYIMREDDVLATLTDVDDPIIPVSEVLRIAEKTFSVISGGGAEAVLARFKSEIEDAFFSKGLEF